MLAAALLAFALPARAMIPPHDFQAEAYTTDALEKEKTYILELGRGKVFFHGPETTRAVAITLDDGPGKDTRAALEVLARHGVKATFFMVGEMVERDPGMARQAAAEGHELANHTMHHRDWCGALGRDGRRAQLFLDELDRTADIIKKAAGVSPKLMRMPYGCHAEWAEKLAEDRGYTPVLWSVDGQDWKKPGTPELIQYYLSHVQPGSVILMHDGGGDRSQSVAALDAILTGLEQKGLKPVTAGEMLRLSTTPDPFAALGSGR
jgi:peptidoglycan/xylan/chitin deacetylase (PgdA/CDA1 family)